MNKLADSASPETILSRLLEEVLCVVIVLLDNAELVTSLAV